MAVGLLEDDGFYIEDDGAGFTTNSPGELFAPGRTTTVQGMGYGLAIVDSIGDAHGWQLTATTSDHGRARFELTNVTILTD